MIADAKDERVLIIRENLWQSVASDTYSAATIILMIGIGWVLGSSAMQWFGFLLSMIFILARAYGSHTKNRMTPQAASDLLHEEYGVTPRMDKPA